MRRSILNATTNTIRGVDVKDWRQSRTIAAAVIGVFLLVQLALPTTRLGDEGDRRFGWQMYSDSDVPPMFVVVTADGAHDVDLADYMAAVRVDVDLVAYLPAHICSTIAGAELVRWDEESYQC